MASLSRSSAGAMAPRLRSPMAAVGVAVAVRVLWALLFGGEPAVQEATDPNAYLLIARRAADGDAFLRSPGWPFGHDGPTSYLSVFYPFALGLVSALLGGASVYVLAVIANVVASATMVHQMFRWTGSLGAAWIVALYPDLVTGSSLLMTEVIGCCLVVMVMRYVAEQRWTVGAVSLAALIWVRPGIQFVAVVIVALAWRRSGVRTAARVAGIVAALVLPLAYHSTVRVGAFGLTSSTWINVCDGSAPGADGGYVAAVACREGSEQSEREWVAASRTQAIDQIAERPLRFIALVPARLWRTAGEQAWGVELARHWSASLTVPAWMYRSMVWVSNAAYVVVVLAGVAGLWRTRRTRRTSRSRRGDIAVCVASLVGVLISFGQPRYLATTIVVVLVPAAAALFQRTASRTEQAGAALPLAL